MLLDSLKMRQGCGRGGGGATAPSVHVLAHFHHVAAGAKTTQIRREASPASVVKTISCQCSFTHTPLHPTHPTHPTHPLTHSLNDYILFISPFLIPAWVFNISELIPSGTIMPQQPGERSPAHFAPHVTGFISILPCSSAGYASETGRKGHSVNAQSDSTYITRIHGGFRQSIPHTDTPFWLSFVSRHHSCFPIKSHLRIRSARPSGF